jgi:eukaryotic-like serine/threonine-protein kinase
VANTPAAPNSDDPNVFGNYRLGNCISTGQHSQVFEAAEELGTTGRRFAVKILQEKCKTDPVQVRSLRHEFKVGSSLSHPNIIKYHEISVTKKHAFFVMEYFPVPNIKGQLGLDKGAMQARCKRVIELVALALDTVHKAGWIHRDVKPDNILCSRSGDVRLIDFSLACRPPSFLAKLLGKKPPIQGTRTYMAPEQILQKPVSIQTDIYSLGVTLFEILAGEPPFKGATPKDLLIRHVAEPAPSPSNFNKNVTPEADAILERMLKKKPQDRYESIDEFLAAFRSVTLYKEAPKDSAVAAKEAADREKLQNTENRLDSRADAARQTYKFETAAVASATPPAAAAPPAAASPAAGAPGAARPPQPGPPRPAPPGPAGQGAPAGQGGRPPAPPAGQAPRPAAPAPAGGRPPGPPGAPRPAVPGGPPPAGGAPRPPGPSGAAPRPSGPPPARPGVAPPGPARTGGLPPAQPGQPPRPVGPGQPSRPPQPGQAGRPSQAPPRPAPPAPAPRQDDLPLADDLPPVM